MTCMDENTGRLITLDSMQIALLKEGERAQEATNLYIKELNLRMQAIKSRSEVLLKESKDLSRDAEDLQKIANSYLSKANKQYEGILGSILVSLKVETPCRSEFRSDSAGNLTSIFIHPQDKAPAS